MAKKKSAKGAGGQRPPAKASKRDGPTVSRRGIKREDDTSQLLERGEGPATGGESGFSTLGGGVHPEEGSPDDAPKYGDWQRHSSGTDSGARGQEGLIYSGEETWGEEQFKTERREEQGERPRGGSRPVRRRPDESLAREIHEVLTNDPELDATEIEVQVEGGAVTLLGKVVSSDAKLLAEELTESFPGVREVHNRLMIER
jgi:osmotically-inducible protein OsmY